MRERLKGAIAFIHHEAAGGVILLIAAISALILANSPLAWLYQGLLDVPLTVKVGPLGVDKPLLLWINDGLMAIFFFLVGLEIKRELLRGELSTPDRALLPAIAAVGGMIVPALIYAIINQSDPVAMRGWAIPAATDIAFAVGVLALLGSRIPPALKVFLLALAILDDLGAIIIIALFYTSQLSLTALAFAAVGIAGLVTLNMRGVTRITPYVLVGIFIWLCVLKSGVHATLAGVIVALAIPLLPAEQAQGHAGKHNGDTVLETLMHDLHPWVAFGVMPIFAFANAGVSLEGVTLDRLMAPIPLGIVLGLFIGKQIGVFGFTYAAVRFGLAKKPAGSSMLQVYGVALLAGIGFTMSLFIGTLAFAGQGAGYAADVRIGVLAGSLLSAVGGYVVLRYLAEPAAAEKPIRA